MTRLTGLGLALGLGLLLFACDPGSTGTGTKEPTDLGIEGAVLAAGSFEGRNDHVVTGGVEVVEVDGRFVVNLGADFSLDGAPDPKVGLGKDGYEKDTKAGNLKAATGASSYELPAGVDPQKYNEVYIWCEKFDVALGVAKLTSK